MMKDTIKIEALINSSLEKVWECWTLPEHITNWNCTSEDWHSPKAENNLQVGGKFSYRMEAKDGGEGFDFEGVYTMVDLMKRIDYTMTDGRKVQTTFDQVEGGVEVVTIFEPENENSFEMQREGWQAILDNFKKYTESQ